MGGRGERVVEVEDGQRPDVTCHTASLGRLFRIMPGSRHLARTLAAVSSVADSPGHRREVPHRVDPSPA
ncbi:hypothetical protein GCM10017562_65630 [Streptomyces roseofulvus]